MRYHTLDTIRGLNLISMMGYHAVWDLVYLFGVHLPWYHTGVAYIWQQSICWTFIVLSGFCWSMGHRKWKRGLEVFLAGLLVTIVTVIAMPRERVVFGVLTCLGSSMLLLTCLEPIFRKISSGIGLAVSLGCFFVFRNINDGYLGFEGIQICRLPNVFYQNMLTSYLGFPEKQFFSTDYFSLFPWFFLFLCGYFLYRMLKEKNCMDSLRGRPIRCLEWMGKHSLILYLIHQPLIYLVLTVIFFVIR